jgi:hypothetical protein
MHFIQFFLNCLHLKTKVLPSFEDLVINNRHSVLSTGSLASTRSVYTAWLVSQSVAVITILLLYNLLLILVYELWLVNIHKGVSYVMYRR